MAPASLWVFPFPLLFPRMPVSTRRPPALEAGGRGRRGGGEEEGAGASYEHERRAPPDLSLSRQNES